MQSVDGRRKLDFCRIFWTGTIIGAELSYIYKQHNWTGSDYKMNGNHCFSDFLRFCICIEWIGVHERNTKMQSFLRVIL